MGRDSNRTVTCSEASGESISPGSRMWPNARDVEVRNPERGAGPSWFSAASIDRDFETRKAGASNRVGGQARGRRLAEARAKVDAHDP